MGMTWGLFPNLEKDQALSVLERVLDFCAQAGIKPLLPAALADRKGCGNLESGLALTEGISLGGDGAFLHMARQGVCQGIPICGINIGRKGFLTEIELPDLEIQLRKIAGGRYDIEERQTLRAAVFRAGELIADAAALNDVVICKSEQTRLVHLSININDGERDAFYSADGIVFATATGSTAYSLSAGGPVVHPSLPVIIITPVCPHTLSTRPLVIPADSWVTVRPAPPYHQITIANDGVTIAVLQPGDVIKVSSGAIKSKFIKLGRYSFYDVWQERLQKGETIQ